MRKQFQEQRAALSREHDAEIARQQAREAEASRLRATVDKLGGVVREHLEDVAARLERAVGRGTESSAEAVEGLREAFAEHAEAVKREAARGADAALKAAAEMREVQEARVLKLETEVEAERERREDAERDQHDRRQTVERMESAEQRVRDLEEQCSLAKQTIAVRVWEPFLPALLPLPTFTVAALGAGDPALDAGEPGGAAGHPVPAGARQVAAGAGRGAGGRGAEGARGPNQRRAPAQEHARKPQQAGRAALQGRRARVSAQLVAIPSRLNSDLLVPE